MIVSLHINHWQRATLFLLLLFHGSSTCAWHKGSWFNRPRRDVKESLSDFEKQSIDSVNNHASSVSDEQNLKNEENIKAALDQLREVLSNDGEEKKSIDPKVMEFFSKRRDFWSLPLHKRNISKKNSPIGVCVEVLSNEIPRPLDDNFSIQFHPTHFVINITDFRQVANAYKCTDTDKNSRHVYALTQEKSRSNTCKQIYRREELLVLPNTKQYFNIDDFKVTTFEVEDGCFCQAT